MGVKRCEPSLAQRVKIAPMLPGKAGDPGRTGQDSRRFVSGCSWCRARARIGRTCQSTTASGRPCTDASRWCHAGVWERMFAALTADRDHP